jgi:hypothetical protein
MNIQAFRVSRTAVFGALSFPLTFLFLYYTLLIHLRLGVGRWPNHISDNPRTLLFHAHEIATGSFFMLGVVLAPLCGICAIALAGAPRTRRVATCFGIFAIGCVLAYAAMHLAPNSFIKWWRD